MRLPHERAGSSRERDIWLEAAATPDFVLLRRRLLRFVVPVAIGVLGWLFVYLGIAAFAPGVVRLKVVGPVTVNLALALGQFVSTFGITFAYLRYAKRQLDPLADRIRERLEGEPT